MREVIHVFTVRNKSDTKMPIGKYLGKRGKWFEAETPLEFA